MLAKISLMTIAAAILFSTASTTFAAPKHKQSPQRLPEPIYFHLATGDLG